MIRPSKATQAYLYSGNVDMRKSIDGLSALVENNLELNPIQDAVFVFYNRGRDKIKIFVLGAVIPP
jgi:transposase